VVAVITAKVGAPKGSLFERFIEVD
jgi:hypothetical protein